MRKPDRIGLVFDYDLAYPRSVLRGIKQFAQSLPRWILVPLDTEEHARRAIRAVHPRGVIALVTSAALARSLRALKCPVVNVAAVVPGLDFPLVSVNHREVGRLAAQHFRECGVTNFGFVGHPEHLYSTEREAGFREALAADGFTPSSFYEQRERSFRQRGRLLVFDRNLQRWLRSLPKPVAVFACHDVWALQVVEACRLVGLRVPEDVAVLGVDNDDLLCELARPSLSSIVIPGERIGFEASQLLQRMMSRGRPPPAPILIPPVRVVARQSSDLVAGNDPDVNAALRFIRSRAQTVVRVEDVLHEVPVSRRSLERRFRAAVGRGLAEEIRRARLECVRGLLATTLLSIDEVAQRTGFSSIYYLSRVFRQETGMTPTAYRRQAQVGLGARSVGTS